MNFTSPRYAFLFLNSKTYIVHVINCEWSRSVNFSLRMFCMRYKHVFFQQMVLEQGFQFRICITCFVSFGIKYNNFMMLEDFVINFLHGYWNYCLMKIDIDVMMLFKIDIKYVKLNFKAIASMECSFRLKLNLLCLYDGSLFLKTG